MNACLTDAETVPGRKPPPFCATGHGIAVLASLSLVLGVAYVAIQWIRRQSIGDATFVSILVGATAVLLLGLRKLYAYILYRGLNFYAFVTPADDPERGLREYIALCGNVFNARWMMVVGIGYGAVVGSSPHILGVWQQDYVLRMALSVFLFSANFVTGVAFYGLIMFFIQAVRMGRLVRVDLWRPANPSTDFLLGATWRINMLAAIYISLSLSGVLFSVIPIRGSIIIYALFAIIILLACLIVPAFPIVRKTKNAKEEALSVIEKLLNDEFQLVLERVRASKEAADINRLVGLLQVRDRIHSVRIWPVKIQSILTAVSVIGLSAMPAILQVILERLVR